jgi:hypothetical protein
VPQSTTSGYDDMSRTSSRGHQSIYVPASKQREDGAVVKKSYILFQSGETKQGKLRSGDWGYFDDNALAFTDNCCFIKLGDSLNNQVVSSRSVWLKDDHAVASWTSNKIKKSLKLGFCTLAKYFVGCTKATRELVATDFFDMLNSNFFGQDLACKVPAPKENSLATGQKGFLIHQVSFKTLVVFHPNSIKRAHRLLNSLRGCIGTLNL